MSWGVRGIARRAGHQVWRPGDHGQLHPWPHLRRQESPPVVTAAAGVEPLFFSKKKKKEQRKATQVILTLWGQRLWQESPLVITAAAATAAGVELILTVHPVKLVWR